MSKSDLLEIFKDKHLRLAILPLLFATLLLVSGTYAWFTYFSDVNSTMSGHVVGWNIDFSTDSVVEEEYYITVDQIYPGMKDFNSELVITNTGEATAMITYKIINAKILDEFYEVGDVIDGEEVTSEYLYELLTTKYPFKFNFQVTNPLIANGETTSFIADLSWAFETFVKVESSDTYDSLKDYYVLNNDKYEEVSVTSQNYSEFEELYYINDAVDTYWGEKATQYKLNNMDSNSIELLIKVSATQVIEE